MENQQLVAVIYRMFDAIDQLMPFYMQNPEDSCIANGNCAACIIDEDGTVYGRMFGDNKPRLRQSYRVAWTKASQVWLTGVRTGAYEKMVFNGEVGENANGIEAPDLIGWEGGQPLTMNDGTKLSVGFSGFRGTIDLEIMAKALAQAQV
jgi:glc operon protein GlcG